jgi:ribosome maturation factor RimP
VQDKKKYNTMLLDQIRQVAEPLCKSEHFELVNVELATSNKENIVRLYIDKQGGITLKDCVFISRQLGDLIDIQIDNIGSYRLEVSSPGPNRSLNKKQDFDRFKGEIITIWTNELIESQKKFTGILEKVYDDSVVILMDKKRLEIADHVISKAELAGHQNGEQ